MLTPEGQATPRTTAPDGSAFLAAFACGAFAFLNLYCTQPLLPLLARVFDVSEGHVGLTVSAATFGVAVSAFTFGLFGERVDRKRTIVRSMAALAVCTLLASTATTLRVLAFWRLIQGLLTPGIFIMTISYVTEEWPARLVPRVMSVYVAGTVFGGFLGRITGGMLAERLGWRSVFVALGIFGMFGAALTARILRPARPRPMPGDRPSPLATVRRNIRNPRLVATFGIGFCMLFTLVSVFSYATFYLVGAPFYLSTEALSWLFAVYLFGLFATLLAGTMLARVGLRVGMLFAIAVSLAGVCTTLVRSLPMVGLGLALTGSGVFIAQTCANSFLRDAAPTGTRVSAAGLYIACYYVGGTVGGVLPAVAWRAAGWPACVALTSTFLILAALLTFFGWRTPPAVGDPILV
jgi:YNFM family putative membrane transporter